MISEQAHRVSLLHLPCRQVIGDCTSVILLRKTKKACSSYRQKVRQVHQTWRLTQLTNSRFKFGNDRRQSDDDQMKALSTRAPVLRISRGVRWLRPEDLRSIF